MKKVLNSAAMVNELKGGSGFFPSRQDDQEATQSPDQAVGQSTNQSIDQSVSQSTSRPVSRLTNKPVIQPVTQPITPSTEQSTILGRPKAFYITQKQDETLDTAAKELGKMLEGKTTQKVDRSTVIRLLLDETNLADSTTVSRLASRLISRLVSQLTS